jgi:hypothetical protein
VIDGREQRGNALGNLQRHAIAHPMPYHWGGDDPEPHITVVKAHSVFTKLTEIGILFHPGDKTIGVGVDFL